MTKLEVNFFFKIPYDVISFFCLRELFWHWPNSTSIVLLNCCYTHDFLSITVKVAALSIVTLDMPTLTVLPAFQLQHVLCTAMLWFKHWVSLVDCYCTITFFLLVWSQTQFICLEMCLKTGYIFDVDAVKMTQPLFSLHFWSDCTDSVSLPNTPTSSLSSSHISSASACHRASKEW